jgi:hypothetical protein
MSGEAAILNGMPVSRAPSGGNYDPLPYYDTGERALITTLTCALRAPRADILSTKVPPQAVPG